MCGITQFFHRWAEGEQSQRAKSLIDKIIIINLCLIFFASITKPRYYVGGKNTPKIWRYRGLKEQKQKVLHQEQQAIT